MTRQIRLILSTPGFWKGFVMGFARGMLLIVIYELLRLLLA